MKRIIALSLMLIMIFVLAACGKETNENSSASVSTSTSKNSTETSTNNDNSLGSDEGATVTIDTVKNAKETDATLFEYEEAEGGVSITGFNGSDEIVSIPQEIGGKSVISVGSLAFANNESILGVKIPDSVVIIEPKAFINCENLKVLVTGSSLEIIMTYAFSNCKSLSDVELNDGLKELHLTCFGFTNLSEIEIPSSVTVIDFPFLQQNGKTLIVIGETGSSIEQHIIENGEEYNIEFQAK